MENTRHFFCILRRACATLLRRWRSRCGTRCASCWGGTWHVEPADKQHTHTTHTLGNAGSIAGNHSGPWEEIKHLGYFPPSQLTFAPQAALRSSSPSRAAGEGRPGSGEEEEMQEISFSSYSLGSPPSPEREEASRRSRRSELFSPPLSASFSQKKIPKEDPCCCS